MFDKKAYMIEWELRNREKRRKYKRNYRLSHPEQQRNWVLAHSKRVKILKKRWRDTHRVERSLYDRLWHKKNGYPSQNREKERRRGLPRSIVLNRRFKNSHLHHLGNGLALYIPSKLHKSVYHSLTKNINMEKINQRVFEWLGICGIWQAGDKSELGRA